MKTFIILFAIVALPSVLAKYENAHVVVGAVLSDKQDDKSGKCKPEEISDIRTALINSLQLVDRYTRRNIRRLGPGYCNNFCTDFKLGHCHMIDPACRNTRRVLETTEVEKRGKKKKDPNVFENIEGTGLELIYDKSDPVLIFKCQVAMDAVLQSIEQQKTFGRYQPACKKLLSHKYALFCFLPPQDEDEEE